MSARMLLSKMKSVFRRPPGQVAPAALLNRVVACLAVIAVAIVWLAVAGVPPFSSGAGTGALPVWYDAALAYLTGYVFHLLVVFLPGRRRQQLLYRVLRGSLRTIANNGSDLIRDLEFTGRCPENPLTEEHTSRVCRANNWNDASIAFVRERLEISREAYRRVEPFLPHLDTEIAVLVQSIDQDFLLKSVAVGKEASEPEGDVLLQMQQEHPVHTVKDGKPVIVRRTFQGYSSMVWKYYQKTQQLSDLLAPVYKRLPNDQLSESEQVLRLPLHRINTSPFSSYPPQAFSDEVGLGA